MTNRVEPAVYSDHETHWSVWVDGAVFLTVLRPSYFEAIKGAKAAAYYPNGALAFTARTGTRGAINLANAKARALVRHLESLGE